MFTIYMSLEIIIKLTLTFILFPITCLHVYWLFGGKIALDGALPTDLSKLKKMFSPSIFLLGTIGLLSPVIIVLIYLILSFYISFGFLDSFKTFSYLFLSIIFLLRGLFGWVINRFTSKTLFKKRNSYIYSPISILLGILMGILVLV